MRGQSHLVRLQLSLENRFEVGGRRRDLVVEQVRVLVEQIGIVEHEVDAGRTLFAQVAHTLEELGPVLGVLDADCVQIGIAHLLADLQVVVSVVDKTLGILG